MKCWTIGCGNEVTTEVLFTSGERSGLCESSECREDIRDGDLVCQDVIDGYQINELHAAMLTRTTAKESTMPKTRTDHNARLMYLAELISAYEKVNDVKAHRGYLQTTRPGGPSTKRITFTYGHQFTGRDATKKAVAYAESICREYGIDV